ncbi:hypothetical protein ABT124_24310 [Streptomyces sp. NPDC001982]|uniref:hypothetical protein n=1 Tax=Streptomyces sp. NPDC001982 TaxID=3154405 RepID=UPI003323C84D
MHADHVREYFRIPPDRLVVCAVFFGHADTEHPVNQFRTTRADAEGRGDRGRPLSACRFA